MNLLTELNAERESILSDVRSLIEQITEETRAAVSHVGTCAPVVVALEGSEPEYYYPRWRSSWEKDKTFASIRASLHGRHITATIHAFPGTLTVEGESEPTERAVIIVAHTADWREMHILPFRINEDGSTRWARPIIKNDFESNLLTTPYAERS